ncbi:hypothetical protein [Sphingomonas sp. BAUL-RG-20F-R05-02]|uniref:hypothetical protein n=1 Tax=Sphingomonas sp. BAUL-RG-20F-R05-02 TaxID=2914830 RepID=UPI001F59A33F|nr:hypothetical protein [Sphingomonas sp. BAUL-RG-20F-R05-02]
MAIEVARYKGSDSSSSPLDCVIVLDGAVIAAERNQTHELPGAAALSCAETTGALAPNRS